MRKSFVQEGLPQLSIRRQAKLLYVNRNRVERAVPKISPEEVQLRLELDQLYPTHPYYGSRRLSKNLQAMGFEIGRGRTLRLMRAMGIVAIYTEPGTTIRAPSHKVYPYLLRNLDVTDSNQFWCTDITYLPMRRGFAYLTAVMD